ncbi:Plasmodium exported protein (Pm-fam-a like), unknown function [Plasmodium malariae]|uniref:Fam-l protein n=1 Tax=Plasmodium malariae TaxID=5858 RepID=A0A1A8X2L5_PLAMA|nr:Plasmodium exported protein (Pm-fam-a like), unknown function [Plasmodium malariae]
MFNISQDENYINDRKLCTRTCRVLTKCNQNRDSSIVGIKENMPNIELRGKKDISNNEKGIYIKSKKSNGSSLNTVRGNKKDRKNMSCIFETKKYSRVEKKIFKELDYIDFLKNNRIISDRIYQKIICKKFALRLSVPILLFLSLLTVFLVELFYGNGLVHGSFKLLNLIIGEKWGKSIRGALPSKGLEWLFKPFTSDKSSKSLYPLNNIFGFILYFVPFIILGITLISRVIYYHKKVKKYEKIKFRHR